MSLSNAEIPNMFYRVYRIERMGEVIASRRIKRMYRGWARAENPLQHALCSCEENAVFLAGSIDDAMLLAVDASAERRASNYWRSVAGLISACCKSAPDQFKVVRHTPQFFAIAISPEWLDIALLKPRYDPKCRRWEWLYPDEITAPVDLEPIEIEQTIAPYDELIEINNNV